MEATCGAMKRSPLLTDQSLHCPTVVTRDKLFRPTMIVEVLQEIPGNQSLQTSLAGPISPMHLSARGDLYCLVHE